MESQSDTRTNRAFDDPEMFNELEFPYLSYVFAGQSQNEEPKMVKIHEREKKNYVFLDDFRGNKVKVKTYSPDQLSSGSGDQ